MSEVNVRLPVKMVPFLGKPLKRSLKEIVAVELYREKKLSLRQAAELIDVSLPEMFSVLERRKTYINYGEEELAEDLKYAGGKR